MSAFFYFAALGCMSISLRSPHSDLLFTTAETHALQPLGKNKKSGQKVVGPTTMILRNPPIFFAARYLSRVLHHRRCSSHRLTFATSRAGDLHEVIFYARKHFSCRGFALKRINGVPSQLETRPFAAAVPFFFAPRNQFQHQVVTWCISRIGPYFGGVLLGGLGVEKMLATIGIGTTVVVVGLQRTCKNN